MKSFRKILPITLILIAIYWLVNDPSSVNNYKDNINNALDMCLIGCLDSTLFSQLNEELNIIYNSIGLREKILINQAVDFDNLNIYTVSSEAFKLTKCGRGNAIYNSRIDAIFIDELLINPTEFTLLGEQSENSMISTKDLPFVSSYLHFIILHELGHRKLHGKTAGFYDVTNDQEGYKMEVEADSFAIVMLQNTIQECLSRGTQTYEDLKDMINLSTVEMSTYEQSRASLIATLSLMNLANKYSSTDYSTFYSDKSHPTFSKRAMRILNQIQNDTLLQLLTRNHAAYYRKAIERTGKMEKYPFIEIQYDKPIISGTFTNNRIYTINNGDLYSYKLGKLKNTTGKRQSTAKAKFRMTIEEDNNDYWDVEEIFSTTTGNVFVQQSNDDDSSFYYIDFNKNSIIEHLNFSNNISEKFGNKVITSTQPSEFNLLTGPSFFYGNDPDQYYVTKDNKFHISLRKDYLEKQFYTQHNKYQDTISLKLDSNHDNYLVFQILSIEHKEEVLLGTVKYDLLRLEFLEPYIFNLSNKIILTNFTNRYKHIPLKGRSINLLIEKDSDKWVAWSLNNKHLPKKIAEHNFLIKEIDKPVDGRLFRDFDPLIDKVQDCGRGKVIVSFRGDSIYLLDLQNEDASVLFHPHSRVVSINSNFGYVGLFVKNSFKLYCINLNKN